MFRRSWILFDADDDGGGGGGNGDDDGKDKPTPSNPEKSYQKLVKREGGDSAAGFLLFTENRDLRQKNRELEAELEKAQKALPKETDVVLTGDDVETWKKYQQLGKPDEIEAGQQKAQALERSLLMGKVAETHQYTQGVLEKLADGLKIELKEIDQDGEKKTVAFVITDDGETLLPDYAKQNWADFLPALQKSDQPQSPTNNVPPSPKPAPQVQVDESIKKKGQQQLRQIIKSSM